MLSCRMFNTLDGSFGVDALNGAIETYNAPEIFNTDRCSQFTNERLNGVLEQHDNRISMTARATRSITSSPSAYGGVENTWRFT
jgi:putative transposase